MKIAAGTDDTVVLVEVVVKPVEVQVPAVVVPIEVRHVAVIVGFAPDRNIQDIFYATIL